MVVATLHTSMPKDGIVFAINGQKHALDSTQLPSATLFDYLRSDSTFTVSMSSFSGARMHLPLSWREKVGQILFPRHRLGYRLARAESSCYATREMCADLYDEADTPCSSPHSCTVGVRAPRVLVERVAVDPALWRCTIWMQLQACIRSPSVMNVLGSSCALDQHVRCDVMFCGHPATQALCKPVISTPR